MDPQKTELEASIDTTDCSSLTERTDSFKPKDNKEPGDFPLDLIQEPPEWTAKQNTKIEEAQRNPLFKEGITRPEDLILPS